MKHTLEYAAQDDGSILEIKDGKVTNRIIPPKGMTTLEALAELSEIVIKSGGSLDPIH